MKKWWAICLLPKGLRGTLDRLDHKNSFSQILAPIKTLMARRLQSFKELLTALLKSCLLKSRSLSLRLMNWSTILKKRHKNIHQFCHKDLINFRPLEKILRKTPYTNSNQPQIYWMMRVWPNFLNLWTVMWHHVVPLSKMWLSLGTRLFKWYVNRKNL